MAQLAVSTDVKLMRATRLRIILFQRATMIKFSKQISIFITVVLAVIIVRAIFSLLTFAPYGSLGSLDGQSLEVDRFAVISYIIVPLLIGVYLIRKCGNRS